MKRLNKRRRKLLGKLLVNTRLNADLRRYAANRLRKLMHDREKNTVIPFPTNAMIELGNVCNLHCMMCPREFIYGKEMDKGFMTLEQAEKIIDELYPYLDSIGLTGLGETFLHPHLADVVKYVKEKKKSIITTISTNAYQKDYKERIVPVLPFVDNIQFSVDGVGEVYETIRPKTSFDEVRDNIRFTMEKGKDVTFMVNCVVMPENFRDMRNVVLFAREMGMGYVNFNPVSIASQPRMKRDFYQFFISEEYLKEVEALEEMKRQFPDMEITGPYFPKDASFHDCIFPWEYPYITWDGYYVPCCGKPFPKLLNFGNVFHSSVMEVLNGEKAQEFRLQWQRNTPPTFCHNCQLTDF